MDPRSCVTDDRPVEAADAGGVEYFVEAPGAMPYSSTSAYKIRSKPSGGRSTQAIIDPYRVGCVSLQVLSVMRWPVAPSQ